MDLNSNEPVMVDQVQLAQAQTKESNDLLALSMDRASQYRALAETLSEQNTRLQTELAETRQALAQANKVIDEIAGSSASSQKSDNSV